MDSRKIIALESLLKNLNDYYQDNPEAIDFLNNTFSEPADIEIFAMKNNIDLDYEAPDLELTTEDLKIAIDKCLKNS